MVTLTNAPYSYEMCILVASEDNKHIHFRQLYIVIRKLNRHYDSNYWLFSVSRSVVSNLMDCSPPGSPMYGIFQRKGSEEGVPENLSVPLEGDRDFGELCGSHQGCQVPFLYFYEDI